MNTNNLDPYTMLWGNNSVPPKNNKGRVSANSSISITKAEMEDMLQSTLSQAKALELLNDMQVKVQQLRKKEITRDLYQQPVTSYKWSSAAFGSTVVNETEPKNDDNMAIPNSSIKKLYVNKKSDIHPMDYYIGSWLINKEGQEETVVTHRKSAMKYKVILNFKYNPSTFNGLEHLSLKARNEADSETFKMLDPARRITPDKDAFLSSLYNIDNQMDEGGYVPSFSKRASRKKGYVNNIDDSVFLEDIEEELPY